MRSAGNALIRVGTLCLLLPDHTLAGRFCVVAGPLTYVKGTHRGHRPIPRRRRVPA